MGSFLLSPHLTEYLTVGLGEWFFLQNGTSGIIGRLKRIIKALARNLVSKSACIAYQHDIRDG